MLVQERSHMDIEQGTHHRRSVAGSDASVCFSDAEDGGSCYSQFYSTTGGSYDEYSFACVSDDPEIGGVDASRRVSSVSSSSSDCSVEIEREAQAIEIKVHLANKVEGEKDCRICHLGLESNSHESGVPIQLGCSCKDDLAAAHKQCAEAWFKIRGNKTCEICNSIARNVAGATEIETTEQSNEANNATGMSAVSAAVPHGETRSFWHGHRFLNFLLACMVFAFVISWLFHFNVPSS
ncbi:Zinc finger, RING-CH-type [Melia azedarach]|uniref:Zinc finger, RING-CH-type n=1 Tax=Melia azedarach TaxID=155640 RepID=A0ACC1WZL3_MELAZ|nr:Zinc finger, RING-CH-type [Melia azedarach]